MIAMKTGKKPRNKEKKDQDMKDLAEFLYWRWKYYSMEEEGKDLQDLQEGELLEGEV